MQDRPSAPDLLDAIADLLIKDVLPFVQEQDLLAYKTLVSWNMLGVVARELREGEGLLDAELSRLRDLLGRQESAATSAAPSLAAKQNQARELGALLAEKIRAEKIADPAHPVWRHVKRTLSETLQVANPRFQTGDS